MEDLKKEIVKSFVPKGVLLPLNEHAKLSIANEKLISIKNFPYKIGRESRLGQNERGLFVKLRIISQPSEPNNDIYLIDGGEPLQISKEHCEISIKDNHYTITDRGSATGTTINGKTFGGNRNIAQEILKDGDIIQIGNEKSEYKFQFLILDF